MPQHTNHINAEEFLEHAMSTWGDAVYRLALSQTRSRADAEDIYQDVFLRLLNNETRFESENHVKAWLLRVAVNRCRDLSRSAWKQRNVTLTPEHDHIAPSIGNEDDAEIWLIVGQLPENQRAAVHLHYVDGYSTEEIASILNAKSTTVRTWLYRARLYAKEQLEEKNMAPTNSTIAAHLVPPPTIQPELKRDPRWQYACEETIPTAPAVLSKGDTR